MNFILGCGYMVPLSLSKKFANSESIPQTFFLYAELHLQLQDAARGCEF